MEIEVKGHSGCQIDVVSEEGQIFVYKSTADPLYLNRLALQAEKQRNASLIEFQQENDCKDAICLFKEFY